MTTHLVIGDPHCTPSASNERFTWAGRMARDLKVDKVICMGDFASMDSMSSYDRKKKSLKVDDIKKIYIMHMMPYKNLIMVWANMNQRCI